MLCSFVNHDPWQDNTGVITSSNRPLYTTCCCHGRSQQRPELRVVRPWFDLDGHWRWGSMRISWLCPQKLVENVGPPESRRISKCPDSSGDEPGWRMRSITKQLVNILLSPLGISMSTLLSNYCHHRSTFVRHLRMLHSTYQTTSSWMLCLLSTIPTSTTVFTWSQQRKTLPDTHANDIID